MVFIVVVVVVSKIWKSNQLNNDIDRGRTMTKVLNFGSLNLDYVYQVNHFVRAGETISSNKRESFLGGKGLNQSIALARAGAKVYHAGAIGNDGEELLKVLKENHIDTTFVKMVDGPSGHAIIQREPDGQNCIFLFAGANRKITDKHIDEAIAGFAAEDYLVLQNEINGIDAIMKKAKAKGMKIILNPSPMDEKIIEAPLELVDIFILNEVEAEALCKTTEPKAIMQTLGERFPSADIVLTLGKNGVWHQSGKNHELLTNGIYEGVVVDTTAAGDTFTGFFVSCISAGQSAQTALEIASKAATLAVSKKGAEASIPTIGEVKAARLVAV